MQWPPFIRINVISLANNSRKFGTPDYAKFDIVRGYEYAVTPFCCKYYETIWYLWLAMFYFRSNLLFYYKYRKLTNNSRQFDTPDYAIFDIVRGYAVTPFWPRGSFFWHLPLGFHTIKGECIWMFIQFREIVLL